MSIQIIPPTSSNARDPRNVSDNRLMRHRLRELCDEVLASYRAAKARELFEEDERNEARAVLARIVPLANR